jgi:DNA polymerase-4
MGVASIGDLAGVDEGILATAFGKHGPEMRRRAQGIDERPIQVDYERKSVSQERTFSRDLSDLMALKRRLWQMSQGVAGYLQRSDLAAGTVAIKLRYADFSTTTRQTTLSVPTDQELVIYRAALTLFERTWDGRTPVRLLGVGAQQLTAPTGQLPLFPLSE